MESFSEKKDDEKKKEKKDDRKKNAEKILQEAIDKELSQQRDTEKKKTSHKLDIKVAKTESKKQSDKILKDKTLLKDSSGSPSVSDADLFKNNEVTSDTSITESESSLTLSNNDSQYSGPPDDPLATSELENDPSGTNTPVKKPPSVEKSAVEPPVTQETDPDLFGKDYPDDKMTRLVGETYCKSRDYDLAISASTQASHLVRRLITGVFKPSGYLKATFTGQVPRAHKVKNPKEIKPLNITAKNAIIEFALKVAQDKNWKNKKGVATTREELQHVMTQRLGELKRSAELNKKKNDSTESSL
ncbi:uncharacterized protein LOC123268281 [Cotesia glomerata]|nr:uncharacterized protein LOC123268281 [Cotesia glomerata]